MLARVPSCQTMSSTRKRQFRKKVYDDEDVQSATEKGNQESTRKDSESPAQDEDVRYVLFCHSLVCFALLA